MTNGDMEQPALDELDEEEDLVLPDDDSPPPEGEGPAASVEDFEPEDPDLEAIIDEE